MIYVAVSYGANDPKPGAIYALSLQGGNIEWANKNINGRMSSSPALYGSKLYIGTDTGTLYCIDAATG